MTALSPETGPLRTHTLLATTRPNCRKRGRDVRLARPKRV